MKNPNIRNKKLTKQELKEINGGAGSCTGDLCKLRGVSSHFMIVGPRGRDGYCC